MNRRLPVRRGGRGFTLIEALVSILIFSVGILALVGLQLAGVKQTTDAKYRTDANLLANELIGKMWVTDRQTATLQNNFATGGAAYNAWVPGVQAALPGSAASAPAVGVDANGVVTIVLYWKAPSDPASAPMHQFTTVAQVR